MTVAGKRVVLVDACHSVTADARASVSPRTQDALAQLRGPPPSPARRDVSTSEIFLYAAAHSQPASEREESNMFDPKAPNAMR